MARLFATELRVANSITGRLVTRPRLSVVGDELLLNGESVVVYILPCVSERAVADQLLRARQRILAGDEDDMSAVPRLVAARNALLPHDVAVGTLAALICHVAADLARSAGLS